MARLTEQQVCTNLWAYLHWLRATGRASLDGGEDLRHWAKTEPERWAASIRSFARLPETPAPLLPWPACKGALVFRSRGPIERRAWPAAALARGEAADLPAELWRPLRAVHPAETMTDAASVLLLDADLRPDDRLLVAGAAPWPWVWALREGATLILCAGTDRPALRRVAADEGATILVAPGIAASFQPAPGGLRRIIDPASGQVVTD